MNGSEQPDSRPTANTPIFLGLDVEQSHLIETLPAKAADHFKQGNPLEAFILEWIAFNALCEAAYGNEAWRFSARIKNGNELPRVADNQPVSGHYRDDGDRGTIHLDTPFDLSIALQERRIEWLIYSHFAKALRDCLNGHSADFSTYQESVNEFCGALDGCETSLTRNWRVQRNQRDNYSSRNRPAVVDYTRLRRYYQQAGKPTIDELNRAGIVYFVRADHPEEVFKALYMIRCNLFHGSRLAREGTTYALVVPSAYRLVRFLNDFALRAMFSLSDR